MYTASPAQFQPETLPVQPHSYVDTPQTPPNLSAKEQEILKWCAIGKSSWEIGRILNCSEAGVNYHFCNIRRKFGVNSRWLALIKALEMGMIHLEGEAELHPTVARITR
ncbi:helix-turn-helix transcriptional regulator [Pseudomonas fluorescens]|uniref:Helix-turn-helix transcriptional regulator n=1 Tax=Pseudomonas fluorescens TaxID=294 RepID=A0A327MJB1_PSEFL|nr:LuxR family transcriptional regulator [Pseudomonas fluorescens]RAI62649.1 helix-turn-helix transcriptional regulator [Pseudomonas fluorescens]